MDNKLEYQIKGVQIEKIFRSDKDRDGNVLVYKKSGNPYTKVDIYVDARAIPDGDFQGKMSFFDSYNEAVDWEIGTALTGSVIKNGKYFNFKMNKQEKKSYSVDIKDLQTRVQKLEKAVFGGEKENNEVEQSIEFTKELMTDEQDDSIDDLPF